MSNEWESTVSRIEFAYRFRCIELWQSYHSDDEIFENAMFDWVVSFAWLYRLLFINERKMYRQPTPNRTAATLCHCWRRGNGIGIFTQSLFDISEKPEPFSPAPNPNRIRSENNSLTKLYLKWNSSVRKSTSALWIIWYLCLFSIAIQLFHHIPDIPPKHRTNATSSSLVAPHPHRRFRNISIIL